MKGFTQTSPLILCSSYFNLKKNTFQTQVLNKITLKVFVPDNKHIMEDNFKNWISSPGKVATPFYEKTQL